MIKNECTFGVIAVWIKGNHKHFALTSIALQDASSGILFTDQMRISPSIFRTIKRCERPFSKVKSGRIRLQTPEKNFSLISHQCFSCFCCLGCCCCCFFLCSILFDLLSFASTTANKASLVYCICCGPCYEAYSSSGSMSSAMMEKHRLLLIIGPNSASARTFLMNSRSFNASCLNSLLLLLFSGLSGVSILYIIIVRKRKEKKIDARNAFYIHCLPV